MMRRRIDVRQADGQAMTEFALILPVFMLIVVGLLAFGRVFFYWIEANHLANETARWAIVDRNPFAPKTLQQYAATSAGGVTQEFASDVKVCIDFQGKTRTSLDLGDPIRVRIQKPFSPLPFIKVGTIMIRGTSTMRTERFDDNVAPSYSDADNIGTCS